MRNLQTILDRKSGLSLPSELGDVVRFAVDSDAGVLFVAGSGLGAAAFMSSDCQMLWCIDLREALEAAGEAPSAALPPDAAVALCEHAPELEALCLGLATGQLLLLRTAGKEAGTTAGRGAGGGHSAAASAPSAEVEEVGSVEGGLAGGAWSPDGEMLALATGAGSLLLMNKEWELVSEVPLRQHAPAHQQPAAAAAAAAAEGQPGGHEQEAGTAALSPADVCVTWRGDGRYFATTSLDAPGAAAATVRVWEWEGGELQLHAQGEAAGGLLACAAWQPNGRHLYAACSKAAGRLAQLAAGQGSGEGQQGTQPQAQLQHKHQQLQPYESEQAEQAAAEGIAHVGAWKRELRRRQAERQATAAALAAGAEGSSGAGSRTATASPAPAAASVVLFERNGLQHGGFELPAAAGSCVEQLAWSPDSEFLAVVLVEEGEHGIPQRVLQAWCRANWHWYLKAERRYPCCGALHCAWDAAAPLLLHVVEAEGSYQQLQFVRGPTVSRRGTAVVVDGSQLLLTPLPHTVVPPPMCAVAAALPAPVSCLAVSDFGEREAIAAVLSDGGLALLSCVEDDLWEETLEEALEERPWDRPGPPRLLPQMLSLDSPALEAAAACDSGGVQAAAWVGERRLLLACTISSSASELLVELEVDPAAGRAREVAAVSRGVAPLLCLASRPAGGALLQEHGGRLLAYSSGGALSPLPAAFPESCPHMAALPAESGQAAAEAGPACGLSARGCLYWGRRQLASDATSFALRHNGPGGAYLLYTTRQHTLHTVSLASLADGTAPVLASAAAAGQQQGQQPAAQQAAQQGQQGFRDSMRAAMRPAAGAAGAAAQDVTVRSIEQGGLLVVVPPGGVEAVLQMPRGNLEAVRPRALVLPAVAAALDAGDYAAAWELACTNRLDLNVLADFRWPRFLAQAREFVAQVPGDQDIADLLSALEEGSTAVPGGLYAAALPAAAAAAAAGVGQAPPDAQQPAEEQQQQNGVQGAAAAPQQSGGEGGGRSKVQAVCSAVRAALEQSDKARYLRAILTSHAKCGDLQAALAAVKEAKEEAMHGRRAEGAPAAEDGLRHLMLFIRDDTLYATALGMYELELGYMVVAHSQKDPGEYLLELQRFADVADPHLRKHSIDVHLRRWDSALRHLVAAGEAHFEAALELARDKGLLRLLLKLVEGNAEWQQRVLVAYAEALEGRNMAEDAALAYIAAGRTEDAIRAYRAAGQWRMCFALAAKCGWDAQQQRRLASGLAEELSGTGRGAEAAAITLEYLKDVDSAVLLLAHAKEWREALRVAYGNARQDLVETVVAPQVAHAAAAALEEVNDNIERVAKYWARLRQLRQRRDAWQAALTAADAESGLPSRQQGLLPEDVLEEDAVSVADSLLSGLSIYTDHTHTGATSVANSTLASTVGGKRRNKQKQSKGKSKSSRIRAGSPQEEEQLVQHLLGLAPSTATCAEVGQLAELLVLLGHLPDAALLQQRLALLVQEQSAAAADILAHPPPGLAQAMPRPQLAALQEAAGPAAAAAVSASLAALPGVELQQRVSAAQAAVRESHWKWDILRKEEAAPAGGQPEAAAQGGGVA